MQESAKWLNSGLFLPSGRVSGEKPDAGLFKFLTFEKICATFPFLLQIIRRVKAAHQARKWLRNRLNRGFAGIRRTRNLLSGAELTGNCIRRQRILFPHLRKNKLFKFLTFRGKRRIFLKKTETCKEIFLRKSHHLHDIYLRYSAKCQNNCISDTIHGLFSANH